MGDLILALDFGGTKLSAALAAVDTATSDRPDWSAHRRILTPGDADAAYELQAMIALARELLSGRTPAAVGVSFGGPVDYARGLVHRSDHVPGWANVPLRDRLSAEFGAPAVVDNDANVAAVGEHHYGAGRGLDDLLYITISTGVGGGWILGGRPWRGHDGIAGEIGHIVVDPGGPACLCGKRGCVERFASGPYMAQDAGERLRLEPSRGEALRRLSLSAAGTLTGRIVAEAAAQGDELAQEILLRGAHALGVGLGNAANLINLQRFILGGGVTKAGETWWAAVRRSAKETALADAHFDIVPAELGDDAPLWGAVALALEAIGRFAV